MLLILPLFPFLSDSESTHSSTRGVCFTVLSVGDLSHGSAARRTNTRAKEVKVRGPWGTCEDELALSVAPAPEEDEEDEDEVAEGVVKGADEDKARGIEGIEEEEDNVEEEDVDDEGAKGGDGEAGDDE